MNENYKYCPKCGTKLNNYTQLCPRCGHNFTVNNNYVAQNIDNERINYTGNNDKKINGDLNITISSKNSFKIGLFVGLGLFVTNLIIFLIIIGIIAYNNPYLFK